MKSYQQLASATMVFGRRIGGAAEVGTRKDIRAPGERAAAGNARPLMAAIAMLVCLILTPVPASAAVMEWNQIALAATVTAGQGPVPQIRTMAIVHVSVHDAVNAIAC
jgi:hypothetical protein